MMNDDEQIQSSTLASHLTAALRIVAHLRHTKALKPWPKLAAPGVRSQKNLCKWWWLGEGCGCCLINYGATGAPCLEPGFSRGRKGPNNCLQSFFLLIARPLSQLDLSPHYLAGNTRALSCPQDTERWTDHGGPIARRGHILDNLGFLV